MKTYIMVGVNLVVLVAVLFSIGLVLPQSYFVERTVVIDAPPREVFQYINNMRDWPTWAPWPPAGDAGVKIDFSEKDRGTNAQYTWNGPSSGNGTVRITGSNMGYGIMYSLDMNDGRQHSGGVFNFSSAPSGTELTWTNEGEFAWSPIERYRGLLIVNSRGSQLQTGLDNLKKAVETAKQQSTADTKTAETKTAETKGAGSNATETKAAQTDATETKAADSSATETKAAEPNAAEAKPKEAETTPPEPQAKKDEKPADSSCQ